MRKLVLAIAAAAVGWSQTVINSPQVKCPGLAPGQIGVPVAFAPPLFLVCVQFDLARFAIDRTTTPFTLRLVPSSGSAVPVIEIPAGVVDGSNPNFTLSVAPVPGLPVMVFRNGLLQMRCASTGCSGDFQQAGTSILFLNAAQNVGGDSAVPLVGDLLQVLYWKAGA